MSNSVRDQRHVARHSSVGRRTRVARSSSPLAHSLEDAASAIGIGTTKLNELITAGELPTFTIGRRRLIAAEDLAAFVRERRAKASRKV